MNGIAISIVEFPWLEQIINETNVADSRQIPQPNRTKEKENKFFAKRVKIENRQERTRAHGENLFVFISYAFTADDLIKLILCCDVLWKLDEASGIRGHTHFQRILCEIFGSPNTATTEQFLLFASFVNLWPFYSAGALERITKLSWSSGFVTSKNYLSKRYNLYAIKRLPIKCCNVITDVGGNHFTFHRPGLIVAETESNDFVHLPAARCCKRQACFELYCITIGHIQQRIKLTHYNWNGNDCASQTFFNGAFNVNNPKL